MTKALHGRKWEGPCFPGLSEFHPVRLSFNLGGAKFHLLFYFWEFELFGENGVFPE
jgi:hypothetical protein